MKNLINLQNLIGANCAAKMETAINKIPGVNKATVSFMTQKLTLDADDDKFESILKAASSAISKIEPDCSIIIK